MGFNCYLQYFIDTHTSLSSSAGGTFNVPNAHATYNLPNADHPSWILRTQIQTEDGTSGIPFGTIRASLLKTVRVGSSRKCLGIQLCDLIYSLLHR